jgi:linoleoyl-CoA desaturase
MQFRPLKFQSPNPADKQFITDVRQRVDAYFTENNLSKKANSAMIVKSLIMLAIYIIPFFIYLVYNPSLSISLILWSIMAFGFAGIGMCIMHDANHGAYTSDHKWNQWIGYSINLAGAFAANWKIQHNILHHTYTNITNFDDDIDDKAILKLSPHTASKPIHQFQHIYAFFFYSIATLYWTFLKDFLQYERYNREGHYRMSFMEHFNLLARLFVSKISYLFVLLAVPTLWFGIPISKSIYCFVLMHLLASKVLTTIFQLAHTIEGTAHPLPNSDLKIENEWAIHQMNTTTNFAQKNRFITWFVGGLNYQIEHHLFPNICHIHYPQLANIVRKTSTEHNIPYLEYPQFTDALRAHVGALKRFGVREGLEEMIN